MAALLPQAAQAASYVPGQILIKTRQDVSDTDLERHLGRNGAVSRGRIHHSSIRVVNVSEENADAVLTALRKLPGIEFAERDGLARAASIANDPYAVAGTEWHLAKIQAPQAWNLTTGATNIVVAILDSGIDASHPDLAGKVLPGYDFVWGDSDPSDDFGHGTAVAGVVGAAGNNGMGVAGVAYGCRLLPVKVMDAEGFASYSCLAQGIRYAVDKGARVINISIAGDWPSKTLQDAINYAYSSNVLVVAAAGNGGSSTPQYPAACEHVLAVSATEPDDSLAYFSSYGTNISLSAPGDNIWTTQLGASTPYGAWRGTSFASPVVAAVAALTVSANPQLSNDQLISLLEQTADGAGYCPSFGYGRVNAFKAVSAANPELAAAFAALPVVSLTSPGDGLACMPGTPVALRAEANASSGSIAFVRFELDGQELATVADAPYAYDWVPAQPGTYSLAAVAIDDQGRSGSSATVTVTVSPAESIAPRIRLVRAPANGARLLNAPVLLEGVAGDNAAVARVELQVNDGPVQVAEGTNLWSALINLVPGPNVLRIRAVDLAGNSSPEIRRTYSWVVRSPLTIQTHGFGRVTPDLDGRLLEVGQTYTVRAVPGRDQIFAGWETRAGHSPVLSFVMQSNLTLVASFVPTPFPVVKGTYAGLMGDTNGVAPENAGSFRLTVTSLGRFTGRLVNAGRAYGFTGRFDLAGNATVTIRRGRTLSPLTVQLHVELGEATDLVSGSVTDGGWAAQMTGDRNVFNSRKNPAQQAGLRSFVLQPADDAAQTAASGASRIWKSGATRVQGKLEDGRAFVLGSVLAKTGDCPFFLSMHRGKEVVIGWLNFPAGADPLANGTVVWVSSGTNAFATTLKATSR